MVGGQQQHTNRNRARLAAVGSRQLDLPPVSVIVDVTSILRRFSFGLVGTLPFNPGLFCKVGRREGYDIGRILADHLLRVLRRQVGGVDGELIIPFEKTGSARK